MPIDLNLNKSLVFHHVNCLFWFNYHLYLFVILIITSNRQPLINMFIRGILLSIICLFLSIIWVNGEEKCATIVGDKIIRIDDVATGNWKNSSYLVCASFYNQINQTG